MFLLMQQGDSVKDSAQGGTLSFAPTFVIGIIWWAYWRTCDLELQGARKWLIWLLQGIAVLSVLASAILNVGRVLVMILASGMTILYVLRKSMKKQAGLASILKTGAIVSILIVLLFSAFSFLRGVNNWDGQISTLFGYTFASYNRLAAVISGDLRYPYAGRGLYISDLISFSSKIHQIIPLDRILDWPEQVEVWGSEFLAVAKAGLDSHMIWSGAFGYIFSDLGWFTSPFLFLYGLIYGALWRELMCGNVTGIALYPFGGFCILFWIGDNYFTSSTLVLLGVVAIILVAYEHFCLEHVTASDSDRVFHLPAERQVES